MTPDSPSSGSQLGAPMHPSGPTVMIVEPLPDQQWKLARMFTVNGYRVVGSASLHAARALLKRFPVDLILLAHDGFEPEWRNKLAELVRDYPKIRILVMGDDDEARAFAEGATGVEWVPRPLHVQDLAEFHTAVA